MTREEVLNIALQIHSRNICIEIATGVGKTLIALKLAQQKTKDLLIYNILIVVPKNVLKEEWKKEIHKWEMDDMLSHITFTTYVSMPKHCLNDYTVVIWDEAQHITDRCIAVIPPNNIVNNILLSATIKKSHKYILNRTFYNLQTLKVDIKDAIEENILPDPEVLLIPLRLDKTKPTQVYIKRKSCRKTVSCSFKERWKYLKDKTLQVNIYCTEQEYYNMLEDDYIIATNQCREVWRRQLAIQRLKYLSEIKTSLVKNILQILNKERTLTFCNSIEQCEKLGKYPIHSGDKTLIENLDKFNRGEINHITGVNCLDEGINAVNLRVGIYANINSSEIKIMQRLGRVLRHEKPVIIIPYYQDTREEEIVERMKENFNPERVHTITYLNEIKSYLK